MNANDILTTIKALARSQGSYGRLLTTITEEQLTYLEQQQFSDPVDLILFLEG